MSLKNTYKVHLCHINDVSDFIETHHYSKNVNGISSLYCFKLVDSKSVIVGGMIYGMLGMANVWKKYADKEDDILELRRLCCINDTPKNTESFFIGQTLQWLYKNTNVKKVISYADETYGHSGVIYQATNFKLVGYTKPQRVIDFEGSLYHDKTIRAKYKGQLKPYAKKIADALLNGTATMIKNGKPEKITTLKDFLEFKGRTDLWDKIVSKTYNKKV